MRVLTDEDLCGRNVLPFSLYRYVKAHKLSSSYMGIPLISTHCIVSAPFKLNCVNRRG